MEKFFRVKYRSGELERYKVLWVGALTVNVREEGGPAVLDRFPPKLVDDRRCFWDISSRIDRQTFLVSRRGEEFANTNLFKAYVSDFANQGASWF